MDRVKVISPNRNKTGGENKDRGETLKQLKRGMGSDHGIKVCEPIGPKAIMY